MVRRNSLPIRTKLGNAGSRNYNVVPPDDSKGHSGKVANEGAVVIGRAR